MDAPGSHQWFLRKHEDGSVFGPIPFEQLARWAVSAQVAPQDYVSTDQENWIKAPMLPELGMDWIVEVTSERLYGPTTLGAVREFMRLGEVDADSFIIDACHATRQQIRDITPLLDAAIDFYPTAAAEEQAIAPGYAGMSIAVQDRIRELEQALREERRALAELEVRYRELETAHATSVETPAELR